MVLGKKKVDGFNELNATLKEVKGRTVILFTGSKDGEKSWCPDCVVAEPVIEKVVAEIASSGDGLELTFIECTVGMRNE
ncbi:unnamed protein product [Gongylonema pulchrum]|uniref:Thioredoxin domain-containing protein 17 n=1 Tax=Gongylonema pulchrum TaxID=637853 RepID=A0A183EXD4_9BILA|nr:unnamed protein product [Gongylonema pulchrum]